MANDDNEKAPDSVWRLPALPPLEAENLKRICAELGLSPGAVDWLMFIVQQVVFMEGMPSAKSTPKRKKELANVARLAKKLSDALATLELEDRTAVHFGFKDSTIRIALDPPDSLRQVFSRGPSVGTFTRSDLICENVLLIGDTLLTLGTVADEAAAKLVGPMVGGRPQDSRALLIRPVAEFAQQNGVHVGRNKQFVRLTEAVFLAAGIDAEPETAIRGFMNDFWPILKEHGAQQLGDE